MVRSLVAVVIARGIFVARHQIASRFVACVLEVLLSIAVDVAPMDVRMVAEMDVNASVIVWVIVATVSRPVRLIAVHALNNHAEPAVQHAVLVASHQLWLYAEQMIRRVQAQGRLLL